MLFEDSSGDYHYYLQDFRYTVYALVNDRGTIEERYRFDPYGKRTVVTNDGSIDEHYGFTGRYHDDSDDTDLIYFRNRRMSGEMGRFVNRDPASYIDGMNLYVGWFVALNMDPFGLEVTNVRKSKPVKVGNYYGTLSWETIQYPCSKGKKSGEAFGHLWELKGDFADWAVLKYIDTFAELGLCIGKLGIVVLGYDFKWTLDPIPVKTGTKKCDTVKGNKIVEGIKKWRTYRIDIYLQLKPHGAIMGWTIDYPLMTPSPEKMDDVRTTVFGKCCLCKKEDDENTGDEKDEDYWFKKDPDYEVHYGIRNK